MPSLLLLIAVGIRLSECFRFAAEPADALVLNGSDVTLACRPSMPSGAGAEIAWRFSPTDSFDDVPPLDAGRGEDGSLTLRAVGGDAPVGRYRCEATDPAIGTVVSRAAAVRVPQLPDFESEPRDLSVYERETAFFPCSLRGDLPIKLPPGSRLRGVVEPKGLGLTIRWLKNEASFHLDESRMTLMPSGALQIDSVERRDHGSYRCNVSIAQGQGYRLSRRGQLIVNTDMSLAETVMAPRFIAEPRSQTAVEGSSVTMDCAAIGNPPPDISWLNNGVAIDLNDLDSRFKLLGSGVLHIDPVRETDEGTYQCRADNKEDSLDATAVLDVQVPPRFIKKPADRTAHEKEDLEFECEIHGRPEPTVRWLKNGEIVSLNNHEMTLVNGNNLRIRGLLVSDSGIFQCVGFNSAGNIQASAKLTVTTTGMDDLDPAEAERPTEPLNLRALIVKPRFVTLSWGEPQSTNGDIEAYTVIYKVNGSLRERTMNTTRLDMNVSQLQPSTAYQFRVIAHNKNGPGTSTAVLDITTQSDDQSLGPPQNLSVIHLNPTTVDVLWQSPQPVPNSKVTVDKYKLIWTKKTGEEVYALTSNLMHRLGDLTPFTEYALRVVALPAGLDGNSTEEAGTPSEQIFIKTLSDFPTAPPSNVTFEALTSTSVAVYWEAPPPETINGNITGYKLKYRKGGRKKPDSISTAADSRTALLKDLERMTVYQVRICVMNVNGTGPYTEWHNVETLQNDLDESRVPNAPNILKGIPSVDSIHVTWTPPKGQNVKIRSYKLTWGKGVPDDNTIVLSEAMRHYTIKNLDRNSEYILTLRGINEVGDGVPAYLSLRTLEKPIVHPIDFEDGDVPPHGNRFNLNPSMLPSLLPPVGVKVDVLTGNTAVVYWTDNTLPKSQINDQRYYLVKYCTVGSQKYHYFNSTNLNAMIDNLKPYTQYEFTVKTIKANRESEWSMVVVNSTLEARPASPPRELSISIPPDGPSNALMLHWLPPSKANGVVTGYVIMHTTDRTKPDRDWVVQAAVGGGTSALVRQLKSSTTHYFKVQARNSKGYGPFSAIVPFTTPIGNGIDESEELGSTRETRQNHSMIMYGVVGLIGVIIFVGIITTTIICCRKGSEPPTSPDSRGKSTYQKSSASNIKPPDLWIHHDQMELKQMDKSHHGSSGSGDGASAMSSMTLQRPPPPRDSCEYDTAMPGGGGGSIHHQPSTGSLDKHHYVPTYVDSLSVSSHMEEPANLSMRNSTLFSGYSNMPMAAFQKSKPILPVDPLGREQSMSSINTCGSGPGMSDTLGSAGMRSIYRPQYSLGTGTRGHMTIDQNTPLLSAPGSSMSGTLPSQSSINSLGQMGNTLPLHHHSSSMGISPMSCSQMSCGIGTAGSILHAPMSPSPSPASEGFPADAREREQGHYVAYEALHPPRDGLEGSGTGSLSRGHTGGTHPLRSFSVPAPPPNEAPHTPLHHNKVSVTIRPTNTSPYKKPPISSASNMPPYPMSTINRLQHGLSSVPHSAEEVEALAPSQSTERLHQEMVNLEGLMKDLNAITASQFEC